MVTVLLVLYWLAVTGLFVYGLNCYVLCRSFGRHREQQTRRLAAVRADHARRTPDTDLPAVTVQLPIYDERFVVQRLIDAVCALDYPADRLQVQVLDDSADETVALVASRVARHRARGVDIEHVRRSDRRGFKAGALAAGLKTARGDLIAVFDADFVPAPDFLRRTVPFLDDPAVGLVQARWGHLNREHSWLTRVQGLAIDGHFGIEQAGRCWGGFLLNFNGTAGVWRRRAIESAGGWTADTLTEDLDLSYRAQLAGWRIEYLPDTEVPAEIPAEILAFKSQQRRWAKGSIQTARKLLGRVLRAPLRPTARLQAVLHLTHYLVHPLMVSVALLAVPVLGLWEGRFGPALFVAMVTLMALGTAGPSFLYLCSQRALGRDPRRTLRALPLLMLVGTGIAVSNTRAVLEALLGQGGEFVRTPKRSLDDAAPGAPAPSGGGYRLPFDPFCLVEAGMALYTAWGLTLYLDRGRWLVGPFLALYAAGFGLVAGRSLFESLRARRGARTAAPATAGRKNRPTLAGEGTA